MLLVLERGADADRDRSCREARRHPVRAQRLRLPPRHVPRARRRGRDLPGLRGERGRPRRVLRRRDRGDHRDRSAARQGAARARARRDLSRRATTSPSGAALKRRDRRDPRRAAGAAHRAARREQAARGQRLEQRTHVRPRDARGDGLLPRHRELLAPPRRPRARRAAVHADRLLPRRTSCWSSTRAT